MILVLFDADKNIKSLIPGGKKVGDKVFAADGTEIMGGCSWDADLIPDQDLRHLYLFTAEGLRIAGKYPDDVRTFTSMERAHLIDRETGQAIDKAVHSFASIEEQIGILRDQLVHVLNVLGIEPTPEFAKLNEIAIREIEAARKKKEVLDAQDDTA